MPDYGHLVTLRKILEHEQRLGCEDRSVTGGLEALLTKWAQDPANGGSHQMLLAARKTLGAYRTLDQGQRATRIAETLNALNDYLDHPRGEYSAANQAATPKTPAANTPSQTRDIDGTWKARDTHDVPAQRHMPIKAGSTLSGRGFSGPASRLDQPASRLQGISTGYARLLQRLGIATIRDLLYHFPRRHIDYRNTKKIMDLALGEVETVVATIWEVHARRARSGLPIIEMVAGDETGTVGAVWFNQPHLPKTLVTHKQVVLSGRVELGSHGQPYFKSPDWEMLGDQLVHTGRLVPVYPLTEGVSGRWLRRLIKRAIDEMACDLQDPLPAALRNERTLLDLESAVTQMHFPDGTHMWERARHRLAFEELLLIQLAVLRRRRSWVDSEGAYAFRIDQRLIGRFLTTLPFTLTEGQLRASAAVASDMAEPRSMARLLQGEVGSGKTVVAATAMLIAAANGRQSILMAPTEILAEQHLRTLSALFEGLGPVDRLDDIVARPLEIRLLTGSMSKRGKERIYDETLRGEVDIIVGTHAVIQEGLHATRLSLAIIDEQHRFGVVQRSLLRQKGYNPDLLVMTATPIPRTLALCLYGDLEMSTIGELPPGRQEVKTLVLGPEQRQSAYEFVRRRVNLNEQAFVICPLVEESEKIEARAATAEHQRLQDQVFPELRLGLLHGRMGSRDKETVMRAFRAGEIHILVSTSVVEVGIDVPNATVMLVEGADRFGLSQLHQFRGRVGRGTKGSYCILLSDSPTAEAEQRLQILAREKNGCALAEEDLRMRGPGELFGTRQSGLPDLKVASLADTALLEEARDAARRILADDPELAAPEHRLLAAKLAAWWNDADVS